MLLNSFKIGGFKVFGDIVALDMKVTSKNTTYLSGNIMHRKTNSATFRNLKSSIIYGGNNTGKSSLLDAIMMMKKIFRRGDVTTFPFPLFKNFCYEHDEMIKFEVDFIHENDNFIYGIEFINEEAIGEYFYINDALMFSRSITGEEEGVYFTYKDFKFATQNLTTNKLIVPYFLEYQKHASVLKSFQVLKLFFEKITFVDNRRNSVDLKKMFDFMEDEKKVNILNKIIESTELFLEGRKVVTEQQLFNDDTFKLIIDDGNFEKEIKTDDDKKNYKLLVESLRVMSVYKDAQGKEVTRPSIIFDSIGTNKFLNLSMIIINTLIEGKILLIDEFDSSLHHKLTRILVILMNSSANKNAQFIMTTHDINLLSSELFRKDQLNFIVRDNDQVEIVSLDEFKANSERDIRSTSNFEKMYVEEKIIPLPETDIYRVIKEFESE